MIVQKISQLFQKRNNELAKGSFIFLVTKGIGIVLTYIFAYWITTKYGAGRWGRFALCMNALNLINMLAMFGFDTMMVRYTSELCSQKKYEQFKHLYKNAAFATISIGAILSILILSYSDFFAKLFVNSANMKPWMVVIGVSIIPNCVLGLNTFTIGGLRKMLPFGIFQNVLSLGLTFVLYFLFQKTIFPIFFERFMQGGILILATYSFTIFIGAFASLIYINKQTKLFKVNSLPFIKFKEMLLQSYPFFISAFSIMLLMSSGLYFLGTYKSDVEIGIFDITCKISFLISTLLVSVSAMATPKFAEHFHKNEFEKLEKTVHDASKLLFWSSLPFYLIIMLFPNQLLKIFGDQFADGRYALYWIASATFFTAISGSVGNLLKMTGYQKVFQNILIVATLLTLLLQNILIPSYGVAGAGCATAIGVTIFTLVSVYYAYRKLGIFTLYIPFAEYFYKKKSID